jgi:beta-lactamase superfamily II metal-dependent hydrolase
MYRLSRRRKTLVTVALISILSMLFLSPLAYGQLSDSLQVAYIDVGQGDSIWLHASDGTDILIEGGLRSAGSTVVAHL